MSAGMPGHTDQCTFWDCHPLDDGTLRQIVQFLLILGTLFLLDIVTTEIILWMGGVELNPFMAGIVSNPALHLGIKAAILFLIFLVSLIAEQRVKGSGTCFYCVLIMLYVFAFVNNTFVILHHIPR